jgi:integrase
MKISELLGKYLNERHLRPASVRSYRGMGKVFADDLKDPDLEALTVDDLLHWRQRILARATPATWNHYHRHAKALWRWALKTGLLEQDPFLRVTSVPVAKVGKKILHQDALATVCDLMAHNPGRYQPAWFWIILLRFMYATGARRRQVVALRWRDIDWDNAVLTFTVEGSKTRREWKIPLTSATMGDLSVLRERTLEYARSSSGYKNDAMLDQQVFRLPLFNPRFRGQQMIEVHLTKLMARLSKESGITISPHRIRHTTATRLASGSNPDLKSIQQYLGHSTLLQTLEYVHPDIDQMRLLHEKLDNRPWDVPTCDLD